MWDEATRGTLWPLSSNVHPRHLEAVPAPLRNALGDCPHNNLSVIGRELVEGLP